MQRLRGIFCKRDTDADFAYGPTGEQQQEKDQQSPTSITDAFKKQGSLKLSQNTGDGRAGECFMETLCADSLALCLMAAVAEDQWSLCSASLVCRLWRQVARREELWEAVVRARWRLRRQCSGKYKYGERTWREAYHVFHRMHRLPSLPGVSGKEVVYAQGFSQRVSCWLLVQHQPACRLADKGSDGGKVLLAKLIIQVLSYTKTANKNLRAEPIFLGLRIAGCLSLFLRDGSQSNPQVISSESELLPTLRNEHGCAATLHDAAEGADGCQIEKARGTDDGGGSRGDGGGSNINTTNTTSTTNTNASNVMSAAGVAAAAAAAASSYGCLRAEPDVLRLHGDTMAAVGPMQCATVDVGLQAQHQMQFEPDLLEACRLMRVQALALLPGTGNKVGASIQTSLENGEAQSWQPIEVRCRFCSEDIVWTHYEQINRGFLVHKDREVANERS